MGPWTNIAALLSAKTKEGGLSVKPTEGLPFLLTEGMDVTFVPPILRFPRSSKVARVEHPAPGKYLVYFEKVTTRSDAEELEGHYCLVRTEDLPDDFDESGELQVVGFLVMDSVFGELGTVARIEENPAHPLLVVEPLEEQESFENQKSSEDQKSFSEVLIPVVDAFIDEIDEDDRIIYVSVPDGLLDL